MRYYRNARRARGNHGVWNDVLKGLRSRTQECPEPHPLHAWQLFMTKKQDEIQTEFNKRWPDAGLDDRYKFSFRGQIARQLLEKESDDVKASLEREAQELYASAKAEAAASAAVDDEHVQL